MSCVALAAGYAGFVEVVEERDGEFSGGVEEVFEFDGFERAVCFDVFDEAALGFFDGVAVKEEVAFDPDDAAVLAEDLESVFYPGGVGGGCLCEFVDVRGVEGAGFKEGFDGVEQLLFLGAEGFLM